MITTTSSASVLQAVVFLTRPLSLIQPPSFMHNMRNMLRVVLNRTFLASQGRRLVLTFTSSSPPRQLHNICNSLGLTWARWFEFFGQKNFDLILETNRLLARYHCFEVGEIPPTLVIWSSPPITASSLTLLAWLNNASIPNRPQQHPAHPSAVTAPLPSHTFQPASTYPRTRTVAQQVIDSDNEDELFSMISKTSITSSTVATTPVSPFSSAISFPEESETSRPSSRTSALSGFSGELSLSSVSSVSMVSIYTEPDESTALIDSSKQRKMRYLYRGGISSTLTGGVMLGRPNPKTIPPRPPTSFRLNVHSTSFTPKMTGNPRMGLTSADP